MQTVFNWIFSVLSGTWNRIEYSVEHMNLTQWAIFGFASLGLGVLALRSRTAH